MGHVLIAFFSMTGETYANGEIITLKKGFTHMAAEYIQEVTGGDLFHIEQVKPYATDHFEMIEEAKQELKTNARVELKAYPDQLDDYDIIILAYPNWWNTLPMPVVSFLTKGDFSGKTIIPFNTNGGGGLGRTVAAIRKYAPGAYVSEGMSVLGTEVEASKAEIQAWAKAQLSEV